MSSYRPDPNYRGTPRQTAGSYFNAVFAILMYGALAKWSWNSAQNYVGGFIATTAALIFGFLCGLQVWGIYWNTMVTMTS